MSSFSPKSSHPSSKAGPQKDIPQHEYKRLILTTCIFQFSRSLLLSFFFPLSVKVMAPTSHASQCMPLLSSLLSMKRLSAQTHMHTQTDRAQTAASVCVITAGRWVKGGRCMEDFNSHRRQTSATENIIWIPTLSQRLYTRVSAGSVWHGAWHYGAVIKEALDLWPPYRHGHRCIVTSHEAGGGLAYCCE